ncbi:MAG: hypothetical protein K5770_01445 [Lachnospiraceae bacterium]|nr:hypothetical protein [Lachnospiraceae bacterium]
MANIKKISELFPYKYIDNNKELWIQLRSFDKIHVSFIDNLPADKNGDKAGEWLKGSPDTDACDFIRNCFKEYDINLSSLEIGNDIHLSFFNYYYWDIFTLNIKSKIHDKNDIVNIDFRFNRKTTIFESDKIITKVTNESGKPINTFGNNGTLELYSPDLDFNETFKSLLMYLSFYYNHDSRNSDIFYKAIEQAKPESLFKNIPKWPKTYFRNFNGYEFIIVGKGYKGINNNDDTKEFCIPGIDAVPDLLFAVSKNLIVLTGKKINSKKESILSSVYDDCIHNIQDWDWRFRNAITNAMVIHAVNYKLGLKIQKLIYVKYSSGNIAFVNYLLNTDRIHSINSRIEGKLDLPKKLSPSDDLLSYLSRIRPSNSDIYGHYHALYTQEGDNTKSPDYLPTVLFSYLFAKSKTNDSFEQFIYYWMSMASLINYYDDSKKGDITIHTSDLMGLYNTVVKIGLLTDDSPKRRKFFALTETDSFKLEDTLYDFIKNRPYVFFRCQFFKDYISCLKESVRKQPLKWLKELKIDFIKNALHLMSIIDSIDLPVTEEWDDLVKHIYDFNETIKELKQTAFKNDNKNADYIRNLEDNYGKDWVSQYYNQIDIIGNKISVMSNTYKSSETIRCLFYTGYTKSNSSSKKEQISALNTWIDEIKQADISSNPENLKNIKLPGIYKIIQTIKLFYGVSDNGDQEKLYFINCLKEDIDFLTKNKKTPELFNNNEANILNWLKNLTKDRTDCILRVLANCLFYLNKNEEDIIIEASKSINKEDEYDETEKTFQIIEAFNNITERKKSSGTDTERYYYNMLQSFYLFRWAHDIESCNFGNYSFKIPDKKENETAEKRIFRTFLLQLPYMYRNKYFHTSRLLPIIRVGSDPNEVILKMYSAAMREWLDSNLFSLLENEAAKQKNKTYKNPYKSIKLKG